MISMVLWYVVKDKKSCLIYRNTYIVLRLLLSCSLLKVSQCLLFLPCLCHGKWREAGTLLICALLSIGCSAGAQLCVILDGSFTDVTLRSACGALFPCHRAVLAACSTYFKAMFTADMKEKSKQQISLSGLGRAALEALLDYAYTARVRITAGNVQGLLRAADRLQFAAVKAACERFLLRHLDAANCMGMHAFAQHHHCPELEKEARRLLLAHFEEVWKQEEFVDVSEEKLRFVLSRDNLNVRKAEAAIEAVVRWVAHDVEERIDCIYELLGCIKVDLDETYLRSALSSAPCRCV